MSGLASRLLVSGVPASLAQQKYAPLVKNPPLGLHISFKHVAVVVIVLASAIGANVGAHLFDVDILDRIPLIGLAVAAAILLTAPIARPDWSILPHSRARRAVSYLSRFGRIDDAGQILAGAGLGNGARARFRLGRVRQYSADRARLKAGQL